VRAHGRLITLRDCPVKNVPIPARRDLAWRGPAG
jgi:hypothetical protein